MPERTQRVQVGVGGDTDIPGAGEESGQRVLFLLCSTSRKKKSSVRGDIRRKYATSRSAGVQERSQPDENEGNPSSYLVPRDDFIGIQSRSADCHSTIRGSTFDPSPLCSPGGFPTFWLFGRCIDRRETEGRCRTPSNTRNYSVYSTLPLRIRYALRYSNATSPSSIQELKLFDCQRFFIVSVTQRPGTAIR